MVQVDKSEHDCNHGCTCGPDDACVCAEFCSCSKYVIDTLRTRAEQAEAELSAMAARGAGDDAFVLGLNERIESLNAKLLEQAGQCASLSMQAELAEARALAAEAEVARLRGAREAALREAAGVCEAQAASWQLVEDGLPGVVVEVCAEVRLCRDKILALLDAKEGGG